MGRNPPDVDSPQIPVNGEIPVTEYLLLEGVAVPVKGPVANIRGFTLDKGSFLKNS